MCTTRRRFQNILITKYIFVIGNNYTLHRKSKTFYRVEFLFIYFIFFRSHRNAFIFYKESFAGAARRAVTNAFPRKPSLTVYHRPTDRPTGRSVYTAQYIIFRTQYSYIKSNSCYFPRVLIHDLLKRS